VSAGEEQTWWYALLPVGRRGPLSREQLLELIHHGAVGRGTLLWRLGLAQWTPAQDCFGAAFHAERHEAGPPTQEPRPSRMPLLLALALCGALALLVRHYATTINASPDPHRQVVRAMLSGGALALALFAGTAASLRRGHSAVARLFGVGYALLGVVILVLVGTVGPQLGRITQSSGRMNDYSVSADDAAGTIRVDGLLGPGVAARFDQVLGTHPLARRVVIDSYGGLVDQALQMARSIGGRGLDAEVDRHCASACLVPFLAGANRYAGPDALFGFHSPGPVEGTSAWLRLGAEREGRLYSEFLRNHGLPRKYLDLVRDTPAQGIARIGAAELAEAGVLELLTADGLPLPAEEARWRFIVAATREGDSPDTSATADLMEAIHRSGHPAAQTYGEPLAHAIEANDASRIRSVVFSMTGAVFDQALPSASPGPLTAFLKVQDGIMQRLAARRDWNACTAFLDGDTSGGRGGKPGDQAADEVEPKLLDNMRAVIDSAAANGWRRSPPDPEARARVAAISHDVAQRVFAQGFTQADLHAGPQARCLFATGLYHEFNQAPGDQPGLYLSALLNMNQP
jgi:hypothetical protein